ncbi:polysaccharide pyruvyl transferase family protein [Brevibacterium renqingii]|uniref:polysaccharide pyruvyl transferase family protein n=1 Tax=Brevibacterium renqingii TaxID=2776916 RepID=UPI001AE090BA|nr:polysaccharide pyruvyl transferase family protein [Brevibacterium renqingii]
MTKSIRKTQKRQLKTWPLPINNRNLVLETLASISRACALMSQKPVVPNRNIPAYWWDLKSNFGDQITPWLIEMLTGRPAYNTMGLPRAGQAVMAAGSIITGMNRGDMTVWGSGLISPLDDLKVEILRSRAPRKIAAVRGERTRSELTTRLGWDVPATLGDPALLLPTYFTPYSRSESSKLPALVPHYAHRKLLPENREENGFETVDVRKPPEVVVAQIANASSIVSTSLHGLIIAQAYGVPWIWLRITDQELIGEDFKFEDFFSTVEKSGVASVETTTNEAANLDIVGLAAQATLPQSRFSSDALIDAFPYDLMPFLPGEYVENSVSKKRQHP